MFKADIKDTGKAYVSIQKAVQFQKIQPETLLENVQDFSLFLGTSLNDWFFNNCNTAAVMMSLLLTLNIFHTLIYCFICYFEQANVCSGKIVSFKL